MMCGIGTIITRLTLQMVLLNEETRSHVVSKLQI